MSNDTYATMLQDLQELEEFVHLLEAKQMASEPDEGEGGQSMPPGSGSPHDMQPPEPSPHPGALSIEVDALPKKKPPFGR